MARTRVGFRSVASAIKRWLPGAAKRKLVRLRDALKGRKASAVPAPVAAGRALVRGGMAGMRARGSSTVPDGGPIAVLAFHPRVVTNPYQRMLYARCVSNGIVPVNLSHIGGLHEAPQLHKLGAKVVLHIHWTHKVLDGATTVEDSRARVERFEETLDRFVADGGSVTWTLHNILPHEHRFADLEARVCAALADRAAAIHIMCESTPEQTAAAGYTLPADRLHLIPHASYLGVYPNYLSQAEARAQLGLAEDHTVLTVFGGMRRYKGLDTLLEAFEAAAAGDPSLRLILAGKPIAFDDIDSLRARCDANPAIVTRFETIPADEVQVYVNAGDVVVLPHTKVLNSGVLGLAYSFGRPVIAPRTGCVTPYVGEDSGVLFDTEDRSSLEAAIATAASLKADRYRSAALERARAYDADAMATDFAAMIRTVVNQERH